MITKILLGVFALLCCYFLYSVGKFIYNECVIPDNHEMIDKAEEDEHLGV